MRVIISRTSDGEWGVEMRTHSGSAEPLRTIGVMNQSGDGRSIESITVMATGPCSGRPGVA